jgi:CDP-diacylglycerol pyrophosphatase
MSIWNRPNMSRTCCGSKLGVLRAFGLGASIYALAAFLLGAASAAQDGLPRNALWEVVHSVCVPGQSQQHNPRPCLQVDLNGGIEKGFAILKDPRGAAQFLLIPTARIFGIESPVILGPDATNYFADAWKARTFINEALARTLPRDGIGLAINSVLSRSQDQLHIHVACVHPNVLEALQKNQGRIGNRWAPFNVSLVGRYYAAIWVSGEDLGPNNPFRLLAGSLPGAARDMGNRTLVVIGLTRTNGAKGFVILADQVKKERYDLANGEELLDHNCSIAAAKK